MTNAFGEIEREFEGEHPGVEVILNIAASSSLRTQIQEGARADVFASANGEHMLLLQEAGLVKAPEIFAENELVLIVPSGNPANISGMEDLAQPGLLLVLALPEVPAGNYAREALSALNAFYGPNYEQAVLDNVVSNEDSVRQVLLKVALGEVDAGLVYASDALSSDQVESLTLPEGVSPAVRYPIAVLVNAGNPAGAQDFVRFVRSEAGQAILRKWGFSSP